MYENLEAFGYAGGAGGIELQDRLLERFDAVVARSPGQISLVAQSLGGVYARALALSNPERVRQVITLGSSLFPTPKVAPR